MLGTFDKDRVWRLAMLLAVATAVVGLVGMIASASGQFVDTEGTVHRNDIEATAAAFVPGNPALSTAGSDGQVVVVPPWDSAALQNPGEGNGKGCVASVTGEADPTDGDSSFDLDYDLPDDCTWTFGGLEYVKETGVTATTGTPVVAELTYRIEENIASTSVGAALHEYYIQFSLSERQPVEGFPHVLFTLDSDLASSAAEIADSCETTTDQPSCSPSEAFAASDDPTTATFEGTVNCDGLPEPCALPHLTTWVFVGVNSDGADQGYVQLAVEIVELRIAVGVEPISTATISGTVTDEATGDPIAGLCVWIHDLVGGVVPGAKTESDGSYVVSDIPPGQKIVEFSNCEAPPTVGSEFGYATTFFDGQVGTDTAHVFDLEEGSVVSDVDAQMVPGGAISGVVTDSKSGNPRGGMCIDVLTPAGGEHGFATSSSDGTYTAFGIAAGEFAVRFSQCKGSEFVWIYDTEFFEGKGSLEEADLLTVESGVRTEDVNAALNSCCPRLEISPQSGPVGTTFTSQGIGFSPLSVASVHLRGPDGNELPVANVATDELGDFTYQVDTSHFAPGTWELWGVDGASGLSSDVIELMVVSDPDPAPPTWPSGSALSAEALGFSTMDLNWPAAVHDVEVTGYRVSIDGIVVATLTGLSFRLEGLEEGTVYAFSVEARDEAGNWSEPLTASARTFVRFADGHGSVFENDIGWMAAKGITRGCNPPTNDRFCPDDFVTRGQMAAFLVRALGLTDDGGGDLFVDDDDSIFEGDIDRLATAGITRGCNPPTNDWFCPDDFVTRGQMAAFLHRAPTIKVDP